MPVSGKCKTGMLKKALVINPYWDSLGGGERYTATFVRHLLDTGWTVDIFTPKNLSSAIKDRFSLDISSANWISRSYSPFVSPLYSLLFWVSDGSLPTSFCKNTLIHLQFPFLHIAGKSFQNFLKAKTYTFVVNSAFTKSFIDREFSITSRVVYPPIDTSQFNPGKKTDTIVYVGRFSNLTQHKGQEILIESFKNISQKLPKWRLVLAGGTSVGTDPAAFSDLEKSATGFPIKFIINPDFNKLKRLFSESRIFWSASGYGVDQNKEPIKTEHFGITVVEAMAAGCVPIIVRAGGHPEIVDHGKNGFLWDKIEQLESLTLELIGKNQFAECLKEARVKSKMFDVSEFNHGFDQIIPK